MHTVHLLSFILFAFIQVGATPTNNNSSSNSPIISLSYGRFQGVVVANTAQYLGIPYAAPPTHKRRFDIPHPPIKIHGVRNATEFGAPCPQQAIPAPDGVPAIPPIAKNASEDCLFVNVVRPAEPSEQKLPVLLFFYGGAFEVGDSSIYPGIGLVNRSIVLGEPMIFVSLNYRGNAFGFLAGKEVVEKGLSNIGLRDQRFALQWVQDNIKAFGGDPKRVTIWGQSAGAIMSSLQMLIHDKKKHLFSAAILESGAPLRLPLPSDQQIFFDGLVDATNCTSAPDRFECLRYAPYPILQSAIDATPGYFSYDSLRLSWVPVQDGSLIPRNPMELVQEGLHAKVPLLVGSTEDEGTEFSLSTLNITNDNQFLDYIKSHYTPYISDEDLQELGRLYPSDPVQGSPFDTGDSHTLSPQYKRMAAVVGDLLFQAPRRWLLQKTCDRQPTYAYRYVRSSPDPSLGSFHGSEIPYFLGFGHNDFIAPDALIYFTGYHNPNPPPESTSLLRLTPWPNWSQANPALFSFYDSPTVNITSDTYRGEGIDLMIRLALQKSS